MKLDRNFFDGTIPSEIGMMGDLIYMDLGRSGECAKDNLRRDNRGKLTSADYINFLQGQTYLKARFHLLSGTSPILLF